MSKADGTYRVKVVVDDKDFEKRLDNVAKAGAKTLAAMTTSIAAVGTAVVSVGKEFETSFAKASTMFGDVSVNVDGLKTKILELSNQTGESATKLNEALYSALSAGVEVTEDMASSMQFLETNTKLAKAGFTDVDTAVQATAKVLNAYGMEVSEIDRVANILINTQNKGITTVAELSSVLAQVTPTAAAMKVSFEQVAAGLAVMTAQGTPTAQATTQLNQLFAELGKSGTIAAENLAKAAIGTDYAGKSFIELMESGESLIDILSVMKSYADKNNLSMIDMFSSIEAGKAALSISSDAEKFNADLNTMTNELSTLDSAYENMMDTLDSQSERAIQQLKNIGIAAYDEMEEPLKESVKNVADSLNELANDPEFKKGMKDTGKLAGELANQLVNIGGELLPLFTKTVSFAAEHTDELAVALGVLSATYGKVKVQSFISKNEKFISAVSKSVNEVGLLNTGLKMLGPSATVGIAIAGISALTIGFAKHMLAQDEVAQSLMNFNDVMGDFNDRINDSNSRLLENIDGLSAEVNTLNEVANSVKSLVDENGNLIGSKDEVILAIDNLNKALGSEALSYDSTTGKIVDQQGKVVDLTSAVNDLISAKKAQIWLDANQDAYAEALQMQQDALAQIEEKLKFINELKNKDYASGSFEELNAQYEDMKTAVSNGALLQEELNKWGKNNAEFLTDIGSLGALQRQVEDLDNVATAQERIIKNVDTMTKAVAESDYDTQRALMAGLDASALNDSAESIEAVKTKIDELTEAKQNLANSGLESEYVQNQIAMYQQAIDEQNALLAEMYEKQKVDFSQSGNDSAQAWSDSMNSKANEGMSNLTNLVQTRWNAFSLQDKKATINVDIIKHESAGPTVGGTTGGSGYRYSPMVRAYSLLNAPEPSSALMNFVNPIGAESSFYSQESTRGIMGNPIRNIAPYAAQMADNRTIQLKQTNNFNVPIERPSDVTRALERQNRDLVKQL